MTPAEVGQSVLVPVPPGDRAKGDARNVLGVVTEIVDGAFYRIGTENGTLSHLYSRNQFQPCSTSFLSPSKVPEKESSLRAAASAASQCGGQGFFHCNCGAKCTTGRCGCRRAQRLCNSRCHNSQSCSNK